jgi:hypothetical protein
MDKNNKGLLIIGGVALAVVVGVVLNNKYHWTDNLKGKEKKDEVPPPTTPVKKAVAAALRGKLPWAVGDVSLWDDEDPNYCGRCKGVCDTGFSEGHSTECDMCMSQCGNK